MFKFVNISLAYYYINAVAYIILPYIIFRSFKVKNRSIEYGIYTQFLLYFPIIMILLILLLKYSIPFSVYLVFFYFSGYFFYIYFYQTGVDININKILILIAALTIIEAILINTVILPSDLPNWPLTAELTKIHSSESRGSVFIGDFKYLRPIGFGGNSSISAVLILSMLAFASKEGKCDIWVKTISILSVICLYSGNGFLLMAMYFVLFGRFKFFNALIMFLFFVIFQDFQKFSISYYITIFFDISENLYSEFVNLELIEVLFGTIFLTESPIGGDFYWLYFFQWFGLIGIFFYILLTIVNLNRINAIPLFFLLISTLHYNVIFSVPGYMLFGYLLSRRSAL